METTGSGSRWEEAYGYSRGVRSGETIAIAGTVAVPPEGERVASGGYAQMLRCCDIAIAAIEALGGRLQDVVRTRMFITDLAEADEIGRAHGEVFGAIRPAATMIVVAGLVDPSYVIELELDAVVGSGQR